jgi:phosphoenolpyruvate phosphomutase
VGDAAFETVRRRSVLKKPRRLRELVRSKQTVVLAGAHDALSAKLIEEAGFDGVWASSFGISASTKCLPDANVLTMTESLEAAKGMNEAVSIPLIADCDNGYGNALNVMRMVREYERAGIAGISIEDNPFPKKCSLYPGERPELVDRDEMAGRIHAAKSAQRTRDFFVIARTEALIAGLGMEEALGRAAAYEEAGADALLIHSKEPTPDEIRAFAARWAGKIPLVAVPTKYPDVSASELGRMGIKIVIFANQALRAAVTSMRSVLGEVRRRGSSGTVEKRITPLKEIFRLVGQPAFEADEQRFVRCYRRSPAAVILAAGVERKLWPLVSERPKAMLEIRGKTILERQTESLKKAGIERIAVVTGYKREKVKLPYILTLHNPRFAETHILYSLFRAEEFMKDKFLFLYGDVLFEETVLEKLLRSKDDVNLVVKRVLFRGAPGAARGAEGPGKAERDWVVARPARSGSGRGEEIAEIGHHLDPRQANGEFAGMALFSKRGAEIFRRTYRELAQRNGHRPFHNAPDLERAQFTDLIQELIDRGVRVNAVPILGGWMDIDTFEDYQKAWEGAGA